jgi:hypothetical protein
MTAQSLLWTAAAASGALAVAATAAEWLRNRRKQLDSVGWMPWQGISMFAFLAAIVLAALALRS